MKKLILIGLVLLGMTLVSATSNIYWYFDTTNYAWFNGTTQTIHSLNLSCSSITGASYDVCAGGGSANATDLNISGDSGAGVILDSEILTVTGSNGITTKVSSNTLIINGSAVTGTDTNETTRVESMLNLSYQDINNSFGNWSLDKSLYFLIASYNASGLILDWNYTGFLLDWSTVIASGGNTTEQIFNAVANSTYLLLEDQRYNETGRIDDLILSLVNETDTNETTRVESMLNLSYQDINNSFGNWTQDRSLYLLIASYNLSGFIIDWEINKTRIAWENLTNWPVCAAGDFLQYDGTLQCSTPSGGAGAGDKWVDGGGYIYPNSTYGDDIRVYGSIEANNWTNATLTSASQITFKTGNNTEEIFNAVANSTYLLQSSYNISGQIQNWNSTGYILKWDDIISSGGNSSTQIFGVINNGTFVTITNKTGNTTSEIFNAVYNGTFLTIYNKTGNTTQEIFNIVANSTYLLLSAYNASGQIQNWNATGNIIDWSTVIASGGNTTEQIFNAVANGTFLLVSDNLGNTSTQIFNIINNGTFVTVLNKTGNNTEEIFNIVANNTYLLISDNTGNTTEEIQTAINSSAFFYNIYTSDLICSDCISGTEITELTDADISNTLTCSDLVAGSEVVADTEVVDDLTIVSTKNGNFTQNLTVANMVIWYNGTHTCFGSC